MENGVPVHRFRVNPGRDNGRLLELHTRIDRGCHRHGPSSSSGWASRCGRRASRRPSRTAGRYDWLVGMPYLFGTTFWAAAARPSAPR